MTGVFCHGRIFAPSFKKGRVEFVDGMIIEIFHVGPLDDIELPSDTNVIDLENRIVIPAFIDAHAHILYYGHSLRKLNLTDCTSLDRIREPITLYAKANPSIPRIMCQGWFQSTINGVALASMLDDLDLRAILIDSFDYHSMCSRFSWGTIHRDKHGRASGFLQDPALIKFAWSFVESLYSTHDKLRALDMAFSSHTAAGYTWVVDMAINEETWKLLAQYRRDRHVSFNIAAYWLIPFSNDQQANLSYVDRAIELNMKYKAPGFTVVGIKIVCDGVVDGCTAVLLQPYSAGGIQCAIHATGDKAVNQAINVLAEVGSPSRRHRIEHLDLTTSDDAKRLGELGITASIQPVHSDPTLLKAWPSLTGPDRCGRAFAYKEFLDGGAPLAIGTDAPSARHLPFPNLYNATTRRSALDPESRKAINPHLGLNLAQAATTATTSAASLKKGLSADFVVTWYRGKNVYDADAHRT
ncbi:amidohydrolase [Aspergillus stella-maris]|uniref:amidohydrolase n=1 Tax=Aspergillus stella-maris TaxID=1810926 RepID=UPI003CCDEA53